jgi:hypothetical protein
MLIKWITLQNLETRSKGEIGDEEEMFLSLKPKLKSYGHSMANDIKNGE